LVKYVIPCVHNCQIGLPELPLDNHMQEGVQYGEHRMIIKG